MKGRHPLWQLLLMRLRALWREPSALFWIFVFPMLISIALGLAFRNQSLSTLTVAVVDGTAGERVQKALAATPGLATQRLGLDEARRALGTGKVALVVVAEEPPRLLVDPGVPEGRTARLLAVDALQRMEGRSDAVLLAEEHVTRPGGRYIDFLIPGLLGFGLMSSSVWGIGWGLVQMRMGKLLKRLVATPMRRVDLLASFILSRLLLALVETVFFLLFARLLFSVRVQGSLLSFFPGGRRRRPLLWRPGPPRRLALAKLGDGQRPHEFGDASHDGALRRLLRRKPLPGLDAAAGEGPSPHRRH